MNSVRLVLSITGAILLFFLSGCSGSSNGSVSPPPPPQISVAIFPAAQNIQTGDKLQFSATVSGTSDTTVSWKAGGVAGGNSMVGTISPSGLYTAPASVPNPNAVTIIATSQADSTASASVVLTIVPPPITVSVAPSSASVMTKYTQKFTASVSGSSNSAVVWEVNGVAGGNSATGGIDTEGTYRAPDSVPSPPIVTVSAVSVSDSTKSASALVTILAPPTPQGKWSFIGPSGVSNSTVSIAADPHDPNSLYASAGFRGVYKSTDKGKTWHLIFSNADNGIAGTTFTPVYVGPTSGTLYLLDPDRKIHISRDGGTTFTVASYPTALQSTINLNLLPFAINPDADSTVYLLADNGLFRSVDSGTTWSQISLPAVSGTKSHFDTQFVVSGSNPETILLAALNGIQASSDGGGIWHLQNNGLDANFLNVQQIIRDFANPKRLLISASYTGSGAPDPSLKFYESTDGGMTWADRGKHGFCLAESQTTPNLLAVIGGLWESPDSGKSWQNIADSADPSAQHAFMIPNGPDTIFYAGQLNLHLSTDGGKSWSVDDSTIQARLINHIEISGSTIYANDAYAGLWLSPDAGSTWKHIVTPYTSIPANGNLMIETFAMNPANPSMIVGISMLKNATYLSQDGGMTWKYVQFTPGVNAGNLVGVTYRVPFGADKSNVVFACGSYGLAKFDLTVQTWSVINPGLGNSPWCLSVGPDPNLPQTVYASLLDGRAFKSEDGGATWNEMAMPGQSTYTSFAINPQNSNEIYAGTVEGAVKSLDGGKAWALIGVAGDIVLDSSTPSTAYALSAFRLQVPYDSGLTWAEVPTKPRDFDTDIAVVPGNGTIYVSTTDAGLLVFKTH